MTDEPSASQAGGPGGAGLPSGAVSPSEADRSSVLLSVLFLRLRSVWPWLVVALVAWIGWEELRKVDLIQVRQVLGTLDNRILLGLLILTGLNLAVAGLYDVAALGRLSRPPRPADRWSVGVVTFAWSNFLTLGPFAGPALRLWLYRPLGVEPKRGRRALIAILAAFSLTLLLWCAAVLIPVPPRLDSPALRLVLGAAAAGIGALILQWARRLPGLPDSLRQGEIHPSGLAGVAAADWLIAWTVFHLAVNSAGDPVALSVTLRAFFLGQLVGLASLIPGGLGSADAFWILSLATPIGGHDRIVAALLLYRFIYYLLPWCFASLYLVGKLVRADRRTGAAIRLGLAAYTFLGGVVLLASAATPSITERLAWLNRSVPLAVVEISHLASAALGFFLLVTSRGLARGRRSSHRAALALFLAGALTSILKGLDYEEALLAAGAAGLLVVFRGAFRREGRLRPPLEFLISVGLFAIVLFSALGFGSFAVPGLPAAWAHFGPAAQAARFLRGLLLLISLVAVVGFHLAQRARAQDRLAGPEEIEGAVSVCRRHSRTTNPLLVAAGDQAIFSPPPPGEGFIGYRTSGRFLVAFSDPVCPAGRERPFLAALLDRADSLDREVILYQISAAFLPVAHDFGFSFFKLGEEGFVNLERFDLKGNRAKKWRHAINRMEKEGGRFELVEGAAVEAVLPELREVSDAWLRRKQATEKGFSVGRFHEDYLRRFPCALVRDPSGRILGFANVLLGAAGGEISVDLMRYLPGPSSEEAGDVIPYLFLQLMRLGRERGYRRFNLGMAPLAAVGEMRWARPFERMAHLFFRHGEHWFNFQGLRRFKEKFEPEWEPRYMAYPRPWDWPAAVTSTAVLIAGGWRSILPLPRRAG